MTSDPPISPPPRYAGAFERRTRALMFSTAGAVLVITVALAALGLSQSWALLLYSTAVGAMLFTLVALVLHRGTVERQVLHHSHSICPECGYAPGELATCPECGVTMTIEERKDAWRTAGYNVP